MALALALFAVVDLRQESPEPVGVQSPEQAVAQSPASPRPAATRGVVLERLAQQQGTVCQTPQGAVCTVAPQPMNSRCDCGGTYGLIVR